MDKKDIKKLFDGDATRAEQEAVERWLAGHASSEEADGLLYEVLQDTTPASADAGKGFRRVCRQLGLLPRPSRRQLVGRWAMRVAASLLLPVAVLSFYFYGEAQRPGQWFEIYAPYGQTRHVELPDGSRVIINSGSKLIYPDRFSRDRRQVFLSGECYADIAKDPGRLFIMSAGEVDIRVLGTQLNLKSYGEDSEVEVTLIEGSLEVDTKLGEDRDRTIRLNPGELVKINKQTGADETFDIHTATYRPVVSGGGLFFMDKRLDEITAYLEKRHDVTINIFDRSLAEKRFIASFVNGESLDEMLNSFNADGSMRISRDGAMINITRQ